MKWLQLCGLLIGLVCLAQNAAAQGLVVNVPAGGDVQGASLQVLAAGGGTINLAAGNYSISGAIVLGSNTTLNGLAARVLPRRPLSMPRRALTPSPW